MNAREVAKLLGVHANTVYSMIRNGEIEAVKEGRSYEIPQSEVNKLKHSKGIENLAVAQERAAYQLLVNIDSEIEADLSQIQMYASWVESNLGAHGISKDDYSNENFEKRRKVYEEDELSPLFKIVETSKNIARLEYLKDELKKIIQESEANNSFEKAQNSIKKQEEEHADLENFHEALLGLSENGGIERLEKATKKLRGEEDERS